MEPFQAKEVTFIHTYNVLQASIGFKVEVVIFGLVLMGNYFAISTRGALIAVGGQTFNLS